MFGKLSAYGFYCRHVKGLKLLNVQLQTEKADQRHAVVFDDVEDALVDSLDTPSSPGAESIARFINARDILVRGCRPRAGMDLFLKLDGAQSEGIFLTGNDFSDVTTIIERAPDVPRKAISKKANLVN